MPIELKDVKPKTASSTEDVKQSFDQAASALIETLLPPDTSSDKKEEAEDSAVLKKNSTEEAEEAVSAEAQDDEETAKDDATKETEKEEEKVAEDEAEEEVKDEADEDATEEATNEAAKASAKKVETNVPYTRFKEVNEKVKEYEPLAKQQMGVIQYCQQNNISPEQYQEALAVQALVNTNPQEALKRLEPLMEQLRVSVGVGLPVDLQKEVDDGTLSEPRAKELAQARLKTTTLQRQNTQAEAQRQQQYQYQLQTSLSSWMQSKVTTNPDFKPKGDEKADDGLFESFLAKNTYYWLQNPPNTIQEAITLADKAFSDVMGLAKRLAPQPRARRTLTSTGTVPRSSETKEPKSYDDVMKNIGRKHGFAV